MDPYIFIHDSVAEISKIMPKEVTNVVIEQNIWDYFCSGANVLIAIANIGLILYIFFRERKSGNDDKEKNRKLGLLKTLIIDYNMDRFYKFYKNVIESTQPLLSEKIDNTLKTDVNEAILALSTEFRQEFVDLFLAIDHNLYNKIIDETDSLTDCITKSLFDEGINLSYKPKFHDEIEAKINETRTNTLKILFSYKGE